MLAAVVWGFLTAAPSALLADADPAEEPVVKAVRDVMPVVVNINAERVIERPATSYDMFFRRFYATRESISVPSLGSGLLVSDEGHVVTNYHVVERAEELTKLQVTLSNRSTYDAKFVRGDPRADLALIKIESDEAFPYFNLKKLSPNHLGQTVVALGNPVGYQNSVSRGILSAANRRLQSENGMLDGLLQTDAAINPGNSGGPLIDINGHLVGINSAKFSGEAIEGIGFAIPGGVVCAWVEDALAIAKGLKPEPVPKSMVPVLREKFGFLIENLDAKNARNLGFRTEVGMLIKEVDPNSPAEQAGLRPGMLIVEIGAFVIQDANSLPRDIESIKQGEPVQFTVVRIETRGRYFRQHGTYVNLVAKR
jgi:S1-C subfamily serine protease